MKLAIDPKEVVAAQDRLISHSIEAGGQVGDDIATLINALTHYRMAALEAQTELKKAAEVAGRGGKKKLK